MSGTLIVLEGIDGAGTTSQARALVERLEAAGHTAHGTREPSDGPIGLLLRQILAGEHQPIDDTTLGLLFAADRADHIQREIEPALARGAIVVSDRYYHSSLAYQGSAEERSWIAMLNDRARVPDLTIFLEVDPEVAAQRRADAARSEELFDRIETQRRVANGYREVLEERRASEPIAILDGEASIEAVAAAIDGAVREHLGLLS